MSTSTSIAIVLSAMTFFILLWSGIVFMLSYLSGWQKLAETYVTTYEPSQTKTCNCVFRHVVNYNGVVYYAATREGLYLKPMALFSIGHKPLFIPWADFERKEPSQSFGGTKLKVKGVPFYINQDVRVLQMS